MVVHRASLCGVNRRIPSEQIDRGPREHFLTLEPATVASTLWRSQAGEHSNSAATPGLRQSAPSLHETISVALPFTVSFRDPGPRMAEV
eukprot:scaffold1954_cov268-Pinguiococcus_pyrenoidosus.AAC.301